MCGLCGVWGHSSPGATRQMMESLIHRGPDANGTYVSEGGTLGHNRLSIIDPTGGDQPLFAEDGKRAIVSNGEIYNHKTLQASLGGRHTFTSNSDAEPVLHLYEEVGPAVVDQLDGMFAIAIADGDDLFLARDPIGIKPLYTGRVDGSLVFASELKALAGLADDVEEFPPGYAYHTKHGWRQYFSMSESQPVPGSAEAHAAHVRATLERSVQKRLMSDVPVGAFLSGGLDSSLIAAIARQHLDELHTFSVGMDGSDDLQAARRVAAHIGSTHHEYVITPEDVEQHLEEIIYVLESYDQDLVRSAVPCYFTSRFASEYVKVVLTGEGADELFAGYDYYGDLDGGSNLHDELRRSIESMHNVNLQRVDRMTMAHSIEGRVPFLDMEMINVAQQVPPEFKIRGGVEKWILRHAFEDLLPEDILWRKKAQFDEGSGMVDVLQTLTERRLASDGASNGNGNGFAGPAPRSHEEETYYELLLSGYDEPEAILANIGRWSVRPAFGAPA